MFLYATPLSFTGFTSWAASQLGEGSPSRAEGFSARTRAKPVNWHIRNTPTYADLLNAAKVKLLAESITLKTMQKLNNQDYNDMDIPKGIGMRLTNKVEVYKKGRE